MTENPYIPYEMVVEKVVVETEDRNLKSFHIRFLHAADARQFEYLPGQFAMLSLFGKGEAAFGIASSPTETGILMFTVNRIGKVTTALHHLEVGAHLWLRGPFGNHFPIERFKQRNLLIVGGGYAFTTLRSLTEFILQSDRASFGSLTVLYGARTPGLLLYRPELEAWERRNDLQVLLTVDRASQGWDRKTGVVPAVLKETAPDPDAYAIVCGPPVMIKYTLPVLAELGFPSERVLLSLEMKMKCGMGVCGRCNVGEKYVCKDGPIFSLAELSALQYEN
jgi:sulfhydrogenase subunit gamma (sulfur reductase)